MLGSPSDRDLVPVALESLDEMRAEEASPTGDECPHWRKATSRNRYRYGSEMAAVEHVSAEPAPPKFLSKGMATAIASYLLVVLTYAQPRLSNDGLWYLAFLRRLFGEQSTGSAYQFGVAFWNVPWFVLARASGALGVHEVSGLPLEELAVEVGAVAAVLLLFPLGWQLLRDTGLGHAPRAILLTIFGTPLFYSALFSPFDTHSLDALGGTVLALLLLRAATVPVISLRLALLLGALLGAMATVRYADVALAAGPAVVLFARRSWIPALTVGAAAIAVAALLFSIPALRGIPYGATADPAFRDNVGTLVKIDPFAPLKMLFSLRRGLFVWTPLTLLSVVGAVLYWRRDRERRLLISSLAAMGIATLLVYVLWGNDWWGGMGFSERFLTGLFPLYLIGLAELLRRRLVLTTALAIACVCFSAFIALYRYYGYEGIGRRDGVDTILGLYRSGEESPSEFARSKLGHPVKERWSTYARVLSGG